MIRTMMLSALVGLATPAALAQSADLVAEGKESFEQACAVCHGKDAKGEGPLSAWLIRIPPDLTKLSARHGGDFPEDYAYYVIDGRADVATHGPREMPVWGVRFGKTDAAAGPAESQARIEAIVAYLKTIQR